MEWAPELGQEDQSPELKWSVMVYRFKFRSRIDQLKDRHEALVRDAQLLRIENPPASKTKLMKAKRLQDQIEELKLAFLN
jgi:hypothetical protein